MQIQERFDRFLEKVKNAIAVTLVDGEGEIILYSFDEDKVSDDDIRLFSAHMVHTMAKNISEKTTDELFIYNRNRSTFCKKLKDDLVLIIIFEGESYRGYAKMYSEDLIEEVEKEFF